MNKTMPAPDELRCSVVDDNDLTVAVLIESINSADTYGQPASKMAYSEANKRAKCGVSPNNNQRLSFAIDGSQLSDDDLFKNRIQPAWYGYVHHFTKSL